MRVIAGSKKGMSLAAPVGRNTRPTLDRVKESLFGILQFDLPDAVVLDLFAGSGGLGLEALSRGAARAVFCDHDRKSIGVIRQNIAKLGMESQSVVYAMDAAAAIRCAVADGYAFDLVFLDPPYASGLAQKAITLLLENGAMRPGGRIIVEHAPENPPETPPGYRVDRRGYGKEIALSIFTAEDRV